ncbi:hypothetical protein [Hansschlegelia beijingensis]|uniref:hypothetical protein n=1 Tax=Hansschlegelia beijingensis TaxID=1133344 RepID=UPI00388E9F48
MAGPLTHRLYELLDLLDRSRIAYRIDRHRSDTVMITATLVGERVEIDVFADGHIEYSRFRGDEGVECDDGGLLRLLREHSEEDARLSRSSGGDRSGATP